MADRCPGCREPVHWFQQTSTASPVWHKNCRTAWWDGYKSASDWAVELCRRVGAPDPGELTQLTNPYQNVVQYESFVRMLKKKYKKRVDRKFTLNF